MDDSKNETYVVWRGGVMKNEAEQNGRTLSLNRTSALKRYTILTIYRRAVPLSDNLPGVLRQLFRLRQQCQAFQHLGIGFSLYIQAFLLAERIHKELTLNV